MRSKRKSKSDNDKSSKKKRTHESKSESATPTTSKEASCDTEEPGMTRCTGTGNADQLKETSPFGSDTSSEGGTLYPCLWQIDVSNPVHNLVSCDGCVYGRFGGDTGGVWSLPVGEKAPETDPQVIIDDLYVGYGLCVDTARKYLLICDDRKLKTYNYGGTLIKKSTMTGVRDPASVYHCSKEDTYAVRHTEAKKQWYYDPNTLKVVNKDRSYARELSPWWMCHKEEPCMTAMAHQMGSLSIYYGDFGRGGSCHMGSLGKGKGRWNNPRDACFDTLGYAIVCDYGNDLVWKINVNVDEQMRSGFEEVLTEEMVPGGRPSCVTLVDNRFLLISSGVSPPYKLSCYKYFLGKTD